ncbi:MAG: hypothetical protein ACOCRX_12420, partial [Candidatus Woesearchaeota archaeon]
DLEKEEISETSMFKAYFPLLQGMEYSYAGEGIEFAPFERKIMFVEDKHLQLTDDNGGTVVVKIYKLSEQKVTQIFSKSEFYEDDNLIPDVKENEDKNDIILKAPLEVGNSWSSNKKNREIVAVDQKVKVPAGTFYQVVKIKISHQDSENTGYDYFAPNIGLIKRDYVGEKFKIKSELESFYLNSVES